MARLYHAPSLGFCLVACLFPERLNSQVPHSAGRWSKPKNVSCSKMLSPGSAALPSGRKETNGDCWNIPMFNKKYIFQGKGSIFQPPQCSFTGKYLVRYTEEVNTNSKKSCLLWISLTHPWKFLKPTPAWMMMMMMMMIPPLHVFFVEMDSSFASISPRACGDAFGCLLAYLCSRCKSSRNRDYQNGPPWSIIDGENRYIHDNTIPNISQPTSDSNQNIVTEERQQKHQQHQTQALRILGKHMRSIKTAVNHKSSKV